ncbi:MAG: ATP-binding protein, partial [Candidatus Acidiferrales bacterium]
VTDFAAEATIALEITRRERQLREVQMELAHVNRVTTIGQLAASIAHELKQPLGAVLLTGQTTLRVLTRSPPDIEKAKQLAAAIIKDVNRATHVLDRIHGFVKKELPRTDNIDLNDAIREVIILTQPEAAKNGVTVRTSLADQLPRIQGDRVELQQVMLNLTINAIQAMSGLADGKRELEITTAPTGQGVHVAVRDTGPGLAAESLEHIFEPFYTTKPGGMGIGLAICRSIIESHAGRLWATGCEPHGALFQFNIPGN